MLPGGSRGRDEGHVGVVRIVEVEGEEPDQARDAEDEQAKNEPVHRLQVFSPHGWGRCRKYNFEY